MSPHHLKTFVQNRVVEINELTSNTVWLHVNSSHNPADLVSRGLLLNELNSSTLWWNGPSFLFENNLKWSQNTILESFNNLPELKLPTTNLLTCAYMMRFIHNIRTKSSDERLHGPLSVEELDKSLMFLTRQAQIKSFPEEYNALLNNVSVKSNRNISSLNIFLDDNKIIRVGGRLVNSEFSYDKKHPILLCSKHAFTCLLFQSQHLKLLHAGPQLLLSHIRDNWWPRGGRNLAKKVVKQCVVCCRLKGKIVQPIMGNLPVERVTANFPFINCEVDYAGPLYILNRKGRGSRLEKCYLCIFVCFSTRAIHLELVTSLSSQSYILAMKRFISRRGKPYQIFSDNGRNFSIIDYASDNHIRFRFCPPYAPHFAGLAEAGVKSCKHHISRVVGNVHMTYEEFGTVLVQIEAVLNSRPMCPLSSDPNDYSPLTPAHFTIGRPLTAPAERDVTAATTHALNRYQRIEQLRQTFWRRWSTEQ
ncbi:hypothetical protein ABMA27_010348 [Loxostege sticticalis]|uniref:Integrase catalytic domain-containing protein n=1 Tax=Loxostege sticticalis TaxID=481309 RepID=A0ABR3H5G0_LOXSC